MKPQQSEVRQESRQAPGSSSSSHATPSLKTPASLLPQLNFTFLTEPYIQQATHLYSYSFILMNSMWKQMDARQHYINILALNRGRIIASVKGGWCCAMFMGSGKSAQNENKAKGEFGIGLGREKLLVAVSPFVDLVDYFNIKPLTGKSKFLDVLGKYGMQLQKQIFQQILKSTKRGEYTYSYGGATLSKYANLGITKKFWSIGLGYFKLTGYKVIFTRSTNRITTKVISSFGGRVVKTVHITEPGVKGQFMQLLRIDLDKLSFDTFGRFYEDADPDTEIEIGIGKDKILEWGEIIRGGL